MRLSARSRPYDAAIAAVFTACPARRLIDELSIARVGVFDYFIHFSAFYSDAAWP